MNRISRRRAIRFAIAGPLALGTVGAASLVATAPDSAPPATPQIRHYTTHPSAELVSSIELADDPYRFTTIYSLKLPLLRRGDVIQAHCQFEVTNDLGFNVMLAHAMLMHSRASVVDHGDRPKGKVVCEYAGENITPGMHHGFRTLVGSTTAERDGDAWISVLLYAASSAAKARDRVRVEKNYGGLRAIVFRNPT